jgi:NAD(P)-dependent dehydrogenase (short-subunit alcohol dehydrogenase family)
MIWKIKNKLCLITGGTSGIGRETALELARRGARVVITYRNEKKADETENWIAWQTEAHIESMYCDLSSFRSIRSFVREFKAKYAHLDVLINNAGIWEPKRKLSVDGIELNFATNYLGPFLLTNLLLDTLHHESQARIINLSSATHKNSAINFDDIEMKNNFNGFRAYAQSKLANILFTKLLAEKLRDEDKDITVNCVHPGVVATHIFDRAGKLAAGMAKMFMLSPAKGAETSVFLATSDFVSITSGKYFTKKVAADSSPASCDMDAAKRLWELSEKYVGL